MASKCKNYEVKAIFQYKNNFTLLNQFCIKISDGYLSSDYGGCVGRVCSSHYIWLESFKFNREEKGRN